MSFCSWVAELKCTGSQQDTKAINYTTCDDAKGCLDVNTDTMLAPEPTGSPVSMLEISWLDDTYRNISNLPRGCTPASGVASAWRFCETLLPLADSREVRGSAYSSLSGRVILRLL